ncbi:MAG: polymer-forming cytoskeletal protein [Candidatus Methylophosphatis roskildensis]
MFFKKSNKPNGRIDSLVGAGTTVTGDLAFSGGLRIDGEVKGNVRSEADSQGVLVISERARVEGEIHVSHLVINGTVAGPVTCTEFLELQPGARVSGDVFYTSLEMHLGAVVQGRLVHQAGGGKAVELKLAASK